MKHIIRSIVILAVLSLGSLIGLAPDRAAAQTDTSWAVEYYNNVSLSGAPALTAQVPGVGFNWTDTAPAAGLPADFYSVRYTAVLNLNSGVYQISTRADDGVRVYVNGTLLINEWHVSSGLTYTRQFTSYPGQNIVVVEYYEGSGVAFLSFDLRPAGTIPPTAPPPTTSATATVTAYYLNVRNAPNPSTSAVLTVISRGQTYPIIGRNAASSWWQINVNGVVGWVSGGYVYAQNTAGVPVTDGGTTPPPAGFTATPTLNLNIRSGPGLGYQVVGWLPAGQSAAIIGRNAASSWWQVQFGGVTGWISGVYTVVYPASGTGTIPITDGSTTPVYYTLTARVNLNIRSGPGVGFPVVGWLPIFQTAQVIGRDTYATWYQISYGQYTGWVSAGYVTLQAGADVNRIPITG